MSITSKHNRTINVLIFHDLCQSFQPQKKRRRFTVIFHTTPEYLHPTLSKILTFGLVPEKSRQFDLSPLLHVQLSTHQPAMKQSGQLVSHFGKFPGPKAFKKYILCHAVVSVILLYVYYQLNGGKLVSMIKHSPIYFKHQVINIPVISYD